MDVDGSGKSMDGIVTLGEDKDGEQEQDREQEKVDKNGYHRSTKRTKISASGSWREGEQERPDASVTAVGPQQHESGMDIIGSSSSSSSTGTVDMGRKDDDGSHESQDPDQDDSITIPCLNRALSTKNSSTTPRTNTPNSATRFTIYEDPDDRQIHRLALLPHLPESWNACPGDNKENMEDDLYDDDGHESLTPVDEFQSSEESDGSNHPRFQHSLNINGYQPDGPLGLSHVDDVVRRGRFTPVEFAGVNTDVDMDMDMDMNEDSEAVNVDYQMDNNVNTAPSPAPRPSGESGDTTTTSTQTTPRHHNTRSPASGEIEVDVEEEEMPRDSFRQRMSFLDAPPRRFLGRNGRRRVHWFIGV